MKTNYVIYNDIHRMSTHQISVNLLEDVQDHCVKVYLGDNYDLKNCKKSKINTTKALITEAKNHFDLWITGNHELNHEFSYFHRSNNVIFTHGDYLMWGKERAEKYRNKPPGAGWFKRHIIIPISQIYKTVNKSYEIRDRTMERVIEMAKYHQVQYVVVGHRHPHSVIRKTKDNITLIVLPRGRNELHL